MKKWLIHIKLFLLVLLSGYLFVFAQKRNARLKIKGIQVNYIRSKPRFTNPEIVKKILKSVDNKLTEKNISQINLYDLEQAVSGNDMIEKAEIYIEPDSQLYVEITEREPIARIRDGNSVYYLDRNGKDMPLSNRYSSRVPLVSGISSARDKKQLFRLLKVIEKDEFFRKQIIGIRVDSAGNFILNTRMGKAKLLLGDTKDLQNKLYRAKVFYNKYWNSDTLYLYKMLNLKYHRQIIGVK